VSTKADFYDGSGPTARWLGSLRYDADPTAVTSLEPGRRALGATSPAAFADAVADLLDAWEHHGIGYGHTPSQGWPWLWSDSSLTDWVYATDTNAVWVTVGHGRRWHRLDPAHRAAPQSATHRPRPTTAVPPHAPLTPPERVVHTPGRTPARARLSTRH
jgi:hypothetical protein